MRNAIQFKLRLVDCTGITCPAETVPVALTLPRHGFLPADGKVPNLAPVNDIPALVGSHTDAFSPGRMATWWVVFPVLPQWTRYPISSFNCMDSKEGITGCEIGSLIEHRDAAEVEPFAQRLLSLGLDVYPLAKPALGWIDESYANETSMAQVKRTRLVSLSWVNFFGPPYVARYGKQLLLGIPGYRAEELPDGGVFHQLTPTFLVDDARAARSLRQAVKHHFARAGLKVTCQAPYVRSQVFGKEEAAPSADTGYGSLAEFRAGLAELLAPSLVLEDGTRVKVVYLEWPALTNAQRKLALTAIRQAAEAELARHPQAPIHFEFNEVPTALRGILDELVRACPRLSYARVEMAPDQ